MVMGIEDETQKKGITVVAYNVGDGWLKAMDRELYSGLAAVKDATLLEQLFSS